MPNIDLNITAKKLIKEFKNMQAGWTPYEIPEKEGEAFLQKTEEMCSEIELLFKPLRETNGMCPEPSKLAQTMETLRLTASHFTEDMEPIIKLFEIIRNDQSRKNQQLRSDLPGAVAWVTCGGPIRTVTEFQDTITRNNHSKPSETDINELLTVLMRSSDRGDDGDTDFNTLCAQLAAKGRPEEDGNTDKMIMEFNRKAEEVQNRITNDLTPLYCQLVSGIISHMTTITDDLMPGALKLTEIIKLITSRFPCAQHYEIYTKLMPQLRNLGLIHKIRASQHCQGIQNEQLFAIMIKIGKGPFPQDIDQLLRQQVTVQAAKCCVISSNGEYVRKKVELLSGIKFATCDNDRGACVWTMARSHMHSATHSPTEQLQNMKKELEEYHRTIVKSEESLQRHRVSLLKELAENTKEMEQLTTELIEEPFRQSLRLTEIGVTREARGQLVEQFTARHTEIPSKLKEIARTGEESSTQASLQEWQDEIKQSVEQFIEQFRDQLSEHAEAATEEQGPVAATTMNVDDVEQHQQTTEQQLHSSYTYYLASSSASH